MKDRNEWFEEVERAYSKLKIVERPYAPPHAAVAVEAEDVLCCLGLHPHVSASDWLVIDLDEVSELIELMTLFADSGMECTVKRYEYLLGAGVWRASCDEGVVRVDEMHLIRPDTFGALMNDIEAAMNCPASEEPTHAYNVVSGMCDACADRCGGTLCQARALHSICYRIHSLLAGDDE